MRTKALPWANGTLFAPMEGVTHPALRDLMAARGGLGLVCTEFVRISRAPLSTKGLLREVVRSPGVPLCVQVMGNEAEKMAEAAGAVAAAGADVVDINLGCPAPRAVRGGVGAAMLKDLDLLHEVLAAMRARVPGLLSAKIRAGFDRADRVVEIGRRVQDAGVDYLVVHPRRRADFFDGVADWRSIRLLVEALDVPVVGNGDVWYAADALRMEQETGCAAVMIGRPALRNPWIFQQVEALRAGRRPPEPDGAAVCDFLLDTVEVLRRAFPPPPGRAARGGPIGKVKELVSYLARAVPDPSLRRDALRAPTLDAILEQFETRVRPLPASGLDLDVEGRLGLERSGRC
jgi:tRNA-dihydrouridine synthase B